MDVIGWQEIAVRLLFASILGSATAVARRWYQTKQFIQSNTQMALGAAMFSILLSLTSEAKFSSQLVLGISIICVGVSLQQQMSFESLNINITIVTRLWCAGVVGSMVGFGLFVPAYIGVLTVILTNLLFQAPEKNSMSDSESELNNDSKLQSGASATKSTTSREIYYQCQLNCLKEDEAEALASLVQLGKEQNLIPTGIRSRNSAQDNSSSTLAIEVDFISDGGRNNPLELQQVSMSLKSRLKVSSVSWLKLSSDSSQKNDEASLENKMLS